MRERHVVLANLRGGKPCPPLAVLDRLAACDPRWRLSWRPPHDQIPGCWVIAEATGGRLYRDAGLARRARFLEGDGKGKVTAALWYGIEDQMDGLHFVASYPDEQFGTEWMFQDLHRCQAALVEYKAEMDLAQWRKEYRVVEEEREANKDFRDQVRTRAMDDYAVLCLKAQSVVNLGIPETTP